MSVRRDLTGVAPVGIGHEYLEIHRPDGTRFEQRLVVGEFLVGARARGAPDDALSVTRVEGAPVVAQLVGDASDVAPVRIHGVDVQVSVSHRREDDLASIG